MKYNFTFRAMGAVFDSIIQKAISDRNVCREIHRTYTEIVRRASDIGNRNRLLGAYAMAAFFIAMNRKDGFSRDENFHILKDGLKSSRLYKTFMGSSKHFFSEKMMENRRIWSKQTYRHSYKNDWVVDFLEKSENYEFGFDYRECGVCKLCRDEGCPELAKYLCALDFMTTEMMGVGLTRTMTLAEGAEKCDFRFHKI